MLCLAVAADKNLGGAGHYYHSDGSSSCACMAGPLAHIALGNIHSGRSLADGV